MLIASFPAGPWQTNCYLVAASADAECVIIDPGVGAADGVRSVVGEQRLRPVAVIATHGHIDHTYAISELCAEYELPCWIHPADRDLLADPYPAMPAGTDTMLADAGYRDRFCEPERVEALTEEEGPTLAGLDFSVLSAPGHTPGSVLLRLPYAQDETLTEVVFAGDVLFASSIGRTDLPRGNQHHMLETLRSVVAPLPDTAAVLPGHGPQTTMARERANNPYLQPDYLDPKHARQHAREKEQP